MSASCSSEISLDVVSSPVHVRRRQQAFSPEYLAEILQGLPSASRFWVAYSGGCDSHALLHACAQLQLRAGAKRFHAVHVDHGLQAESAEWARHCAAVCTELDIPITLLQVVAVAGVGESPEAAARHARYRAFAGIMQSSDCLLTAHHQDDQAETLLLQLLRGGGPHGLAAMPDLCTFAVGLHARPLLTFSRQELRNYAQRHSLQWIDDPSNTDSGIDRNYLRNTVMPSLGARWPAVARVLARSASHQAEAAQLLDVLAAGDLRRCENPNHALCITRLLALDAVRQRNLLRYWLKSLGFKLPDSVRLAKLQHEVLYAAPDRIPEVLWDGAVVRRYRGYLYAMAPQATIDVNAVMQWSLDKPLPLPDGGTLVAMQQYGTGVKSALCRQQPVTVRYRHGGEHCQPARNGITRPLKKLLQEAGVPPWERERIPLIYVGDRLAAVAGYWVCGPCHAEEDEEGLVFEWRHGEQACA